MSFTVMTEFKFETGKALVEAAGLQSAVEGISNKANQALVSLQNVGLALSGNVGLDLTGGLSFLGLGLKALTAFEDANASALTFANIISANLDRMSGSVGTFNERMSLSRQIMKDIASDATKFSLDEKALMGMTKNVSALLIPKGLGGENLSGARDLSRNLLKASPSLGLDPYEVQGQMMRMIEGNASMGDTMFRRLMSETASFEKLRGAADAAKQFNRMPLKERFQMLSSGLNQFAKDVDVLTGLASTLSAYFQKLKNMMFGANGILLPLGEALSGPVKQALQQTTKIVDGDLRTVFVELANTIKMLIPDMEIFIAQLMQLQQLAQSFTISTVLIGIFQLIAILRVIGLVNPAALTKLFTYLKSGIVSLLSYVRSAAWLKAVFVFATASLSKFLVVLLGLVAIFQLIARAIAYAKIEDLKSLPSAIAAFMSAARKLYAFILVFFQPIIDAFNAIAKFISPIFQLTGWIDAASSALDFFGNILIKVVAMIRGISFVIMQIFSDLANGTLSTFQSIKDAYLSGTDSFLTEVFNRAQMLDEIQDKPSAQNLTIVENMEVKMNNNFKENMEPDRIAFTLRDQLLKVATNPNSAPGKSLRAAGAISGW